MKRVNWTAVATWFVAPIILAAFWFPTIHTTVRWAS